MPSEPSGGGDLHARRLDLAGTRDFTVAGAGEARRERLAAYLDRWVAHVWDEAVGAPDRPGLALAAVGSLARRDCGPLSDLDLVLIHDPAALPSGDVVVLADRIWYPMWDAKAGLDHSVRTVAQCRQVAETDLAAAVGLLDLRYLAGDAELVAATRAAIDKDWRSALRTRLPQLAESVAARHARHGELAHLVEPDLKEARGGLRDMSVLRALTRAWLADRPHGGVDAAYRHLLDVRDAVHVVTGRSRDRLALPDHDAVAALLGYPDADLLLTDVSRDARTLTYAVDATLRRARQSQRARFLRIGPRRPTLRSLGYGLFEHDGEVVLGAGVDPAADPLLVLRAAVLSARTGRPLAPTTAANLATRSPRLPTPWPAEALALFTDLLASGPGLVGTWEALDLAGVVEAWLPEWAAVRSRPQRNAVHRHTVDRHLVEVVVAATAHLDGVARPDLLLLAALFHDIGKVAGSHDHSHTGAGIADAALRRLGLADEDRELVVRLVREHLTLIELATRRDPADPATLASVVTAVDGSAEVLEHLIRLTEADAVATGPSAWTDWRRALLDRLVRISRAELAQRPAQRRPAGWAPTEVAAPSRPRPPGRARSGSGSGSGDPGIVVEVSSHGSAHELRVVAPDRLGLFADTAGLFAAAGLVVRSAVLRTQEGVAEDVWHVESPSGDAPLAADLERDLARLGAGDRAPLARLTRRTAGRAGAQRGTAGPLRTRAFVVPEASTTATVVEVRAGDRPGLLHDIAGTLTGVGLDIRSAHIATYAGQALDTFYLTTDGGRVLDPAEAALAVAAIIDACG